MFHRLLALVASGLLSLGLASAQVPEAESFVTALVDELRATAEASGEGSVEVRAVLEANLATEAIGNFLIRGSAADDMSDEQRARYNQLFPRYIAAAFAEEIGQLTARRIDVKGSLERRPGDIIVQSELFDDAGKKRASIDWRVRVLDTGEYKLLDVLVERISPLITRRQTFSAMVRDDGIEGLLMHMEGVIAGEISS